MLDEKYYLTQVEKTMDKLRATCLGQDVALTAILPEHFKGRPPEEQAKQLTEQIIFALAAAADYENEPLYQLMECRKWLYEVTLYLLLQCNKEDQTFEQMKTLISLPQSVRCILFLSFREGSCKELLQDDPPNLLKELDISILSLLRIHGLGQPMREKHSKATEILNK
jgi:hypothetical protein